MESSLSKHITELNKLSYKDQCAYIAKRLISMEPDDITHPTFFKKLQIILIDIPDIFNDIIKDLNIEDEGGCNYCFNSNMFDDYFFHKIEAHIPIYCKRTSQDEYLVTIPIKNNLEDISTIIKINNNNLHIYYIHFYISFDF